MRSILIVLAAGVAILASISPVLAFGGASYTGPVAGTYTTSGGTSGSFNGQASGTALDATFSGTADLSGQGIPVSGYSADGRVGFVGTFTGDPTRGGHFSGQVFWAAEPLAGLAVGAGLLGARALRRR